MVWSASIINRKIEADVLYGVSLTCSHTHTVEKHRKPRMQACIFMFRDKKKNMNNKRKKDLHVCLLIQDMRHGFPI